MSYNLSNNMATFENIRWCDSNEFEYFKPERLDTDSLYVEGLYVAMYSLRRAVCGKDAVAVPLIIIGKNENIFSFRPFNKPDKPSEKVLEFQVTENNYINSSKVFVSEVPVKKGYIRDHIEGLDGTPPEVDISEEIAKANEHLVLTG